MTDLKLADALATQLRVDAIRSTTAAGSGHPTSALSLADILAILALGHLRYDFHHPLAAGNDRLVLSKGHACPALYALYRAVGAITDPELLSLRRSGSPLQGHPTPELPYVPVATGSLGMGLSYGVGLAYGGRFLDGIPYRTWVLLGDSELGEGSNYEALWAAAHFQLNNLIAIVDVNRLGQQGPTIEGWNTGAYRARFAGFGWHVIEVDGHDLAALDRALSEATAQTTRPVCILARTIKGYGVSFLADAEGWHGRALTSEEASRALAELDSGTPLQFKVAPPVIAGILGAVAGQRTEPFEAVAAKPLNQPSSVRDAFGAALVACGRTRADLLVLDAEVSNSTQTHAFKQAFPNRFIELRIAEQLLVNVAQGLAWGGRRIVFAATFAAFFSRAHDQLRMAAVAGADLRLAGSHAGVEIGQDGPSQMGLEDIALFRGLHGSTVLCPADAIATTHLVQAMIGNQGITYLRLTRGKLPVIYSAETDFPIGGSKVLRSSETDIATIIGTGATVHQALLAAQTLAAEGVQVRVIDAYSIKPLDAATILRAALETEHLVVVEDHRPVGGLGEAVLSALAQGGAAGVRVTHHAVRGMPQSATPSEQYERFGLDAAHLVQSIRTPATAPHALGEAVVGMVH